MTTLIGDKQPDRANVGDIVKIDGYGSELFEVISIYETHYESIEEEYRVIEYEVLGVRDKRNYYAEDNDITVVERKEKAKEIAEDSPSIDELLDEIRSYRTVIQVYGEKSGKGIEFKRKIEEIKDKLREVVINNAAR